MKKSFFFAAFLLATAAMSLMSCKNNKNQAGNESETYTSGAMQFASDESFSPLVEAERKQFQDNCKGNAQITAIYTDAQDGFDQLMSGKVHLYFSSRKLTQNDSLLIKHNLNVSPLVYTLGYDGVTLIVNKENKDTCITVRDVQRILSGEATNWNQIVPGSKRGNIEVVFDNKRSATVQYCVESILGGKDMVSPNIVAAKNSQGVIDYVEKSPNAIGVIGSNWVMDHRDTRHLTFKMNIQVMSVTNADKATPYNSYKPFQYYLLDGTYPFVRTIYAILAGAGYQLSRGFAEYCASDKGQLIVMRSGLLPYRADINLKEVNAK